MAGKTHRQFGTIQLQRSGRYRASYTGPDRARHNAPDTYGTKTAAAAWLDRVRTRIADGQWTADDPDGKRAHVAAAAAPVATLRDYAEGWLAGRTLRPRTREHYRKLLDRMILPGLGDLPLTDLTPGRVRAWHSALGTGTPTLRSHAYGLLRTIAGTAVTEGELPGNPCAIRGAGSVKRKVTIEPATAAQVNDVAAAMPERYRCLVQVTAWCALRFGEAAELRRRDVVDEGATLRIRRGVARAAGEVIVGKPKSEAGIRDVAVPPHVRPLLLAHLAQHVASGPDALLWPAADGHGALAPSTLYKVFYPARKAAGRADLRWHDLRHTGAVLAAQAGGTTAELMGRLGHSTPGASMRYQHVAAGRDAALAQRMSAMVAPSAGKAARRKGKGKGGLKLVG